MHASILAVALCKAMVADKPVAQPEVARPTADSKLVDDAYSERGSSQTRAEAPIQATTSRADTIIAPAVVRSDGSIDIVPLAQRQTNAQQETRPGLDAAGLDSAARNINSALERRSVLGIEGVGLAAPSADGVIDVLRTMSAQDKAKLETRYQELYGVSLTDHLKTKLATPDLQRALGALDQGNAKTDNRGPVESALSKLEQINSAERENPRLYTNERKAVELDLRQTLAHLNSSEIEQLKNDYRQKNGREIDADLLNNERITAETRNALAIYLKGTDRRTADDTSKLAELGLSSKLIDVFHSAFANASQEQRQAFLNADGAKKLESSFSGRDRELARDYLESGEARLSTLVKFNTNYFATLTNNDQIELILTNASREEKTKFKLGRELSLTSRAASDLSADEKTALATYNDLHDALSKAGDVREVIMWEEQMLNRGNLISDIARTHSNGIAGVVFAGHKTQDLLSRLEDMSEKDWKLLKTDTQYRKDLETLLKSFATPEEQARAVALIKQKVDAETYTESQKHRRGISEVLGDARSGLFNTNIDKDAIVKALVNLSPVEQELYRQDQAFGADLDKKLRESLGADSAEALLAQRLLLRVKEGGKPELDAIDQVLIDAAKNQELHKSTKDIEIAFSTVPGLRERLISPQSEEDRQLRNFFLAAARLPRVGDGGALFQEGRLPLSTKLDLTADKKTMFDDVMKATDEEKKMLLSKDDTNADAKKFREAVLGRFSQSEQQLLLNGLQQGGFGTEDKIRAFALGGGDQQETRELLLSAAKTPSDQARLRNEYARKYGTDMAGDVLKQVTDSDKLEFRNKLLPPYAATPGQDYNDLRSQFYRSKEGLAAWLMQQGLGDGSLNSADAALADYSKQLEKYSKNFNDFPPELQKELTQQMNQALEGFRESKGATSEALVDTTVAVASFAGAFATGGISLSMLATIGGVGGVYRVAALKALEGQDFNDSPENIVRQLMTGTLSTAAAFVGPAELKALFGVGEKAASGATSQLLARGIVSEAEKAQLEKILTSEIRRGLTENSDLNRESLMALVKPVVGEQRAEQVASELSQRTNIEMQKGAREYLAGVVRDYGAVVASGAAANVASELVTAPLNWDSSLSVEQNLEALGRKTLLAGAAGFLGTVVLGGVGVAAGEAVSAAKNMGRLYRDENGKLMLQAGPKGLSLSRDGAKIEIKPGEFVPVKDSDLFVPREGTPAPNKTPGYERDGVWYPQRVLTRFSNDEVEAATAHLAKQMKLANPEAIKDFVDRYQKLANDWRADNAPGKALAEEFRQRQTQAHQYLVQNMATNGLTQDQIREIVSDPAKLAARLQTEGPALAPLVQRLDTLTKIADQRKDQLQEMINAVTDKQGLPRIEVTFNEGGGANANYGAGQIFLPRQLLFDLDNPENLKVLFHEISHSEQEFTAIRRLAQRAKDVNELRALYESEVKMSPISPVPSDSYFKQAMDLNQNLPKLTAEQEAIADRLINNWKNTSPARRDYFDIVDDITRIQTVTEHFDGPNGLAAVTRDIGFLSRGSGHFGQEYSVPGSPDLAQDPRLKYMIDQLDKSTNGLPNNWDPAQARILLKELYAKRIEQLNAYREMQWSGYAGPDNKVEWDAWLIGELAGREAARASR